MKRKFNEELSGNEVYLTARIIMICARSQDQILALDLENVLHLLESVLQLLTLWLAVSITRGYVALRPCTRSFVMRIQGLGVRIYVSRLGFEV